jgi:hypothetical protein
LGRTSGWGRPLPSPAVLLNEDVDQQDDQDDCDERSDADVHVDLLSLVSLSFVRSTRLTPPLIRAHLLAPLRRCKDAVRNPCGCGTSSSGSLARRSSPGSRRPVERSSHRRLRCRRSCRRRRRRCRLHRRSRLRRRCRLRRRSRRSRLRRRCRHHRCGHLRLRPYHLRLCVRPRFRLRSRHHPHRVRPRAALRRRRSEFQSSRSRRSASASPPGRAERPEPHRPEARRQAAPSRPVAARRRRPPAAPVLSRARPESPRTNESCASQPRGSGSPGAGPGRTCV